MFVVCCCFGKAYTVELEAELNQLKEENAQLKHALVLTHLVKEFIHFCGSDCNN